MKDIKQFACSNGVVVGNANLDHDKVTFACSPELNGVYGADDVELVWQYEIENEPGFWFTSRDQSHFKNGFKEWADYMLSIGCVNTRQFLQLKPQPMSELPIPKMETTELPSPENKYRVGRRSGTVILTVNGQTEIGRIHDPEMALLVCDFLNNL